MKHYLAAMLVATSATSALAADLPSRKLDPVPVFVQLPAVDGVNGKLELFGGEATRLQQDPTNPFAFRQKWKPTGGAMGSMSLPVGHDFGVQLDGMLASIGGSFAGGGAAHAFWRDPSKGLFGAYGGATYIGRSGGLGVGRLGLEAEAYLGRVTLQGIGGVEFGRGSSTRFGYPWIAPGGAFGFFTRLREPVKTRPFDRVAIAFYPVDDLKLAVGHRYALGRHAATLDAEYMLTHGATAVSLFAEGRLGQRGANSAIGGLKVYFGNREKSLIRRHREDDPLNYQFDGATYAGGGAVGPNGMIAAPPIEKGCIQCD